MSSLLPLLKRHLLDFVFPSFCLGCHKEGTFLCGLCFQAIPRQVHQVCPSCYQVSLEGRRCHPCRAKNPSPLDGVLASSSLTHGSLLSKAIHALKYDFVRELTDPLTRLLLQTLEPFPHFCREFLFCPLPLHPRREQWRGFNQSAELTLSLLNQCRARFHLDFQIQQVLTRTIFQKPQMELSREERLLNVMDAFQVLPNAAVASRHILLIDDVATTLATLESAALALKNAGAAQVFGLVLARA